MKPLMGQEYLNSTSELAGATISRLEPSEPEHTGPSDTPFRLAEKKNIKMKLRSRGNGTQSTQSFITTLAYYLSENFWHF